MIYRQDKYHKHNKHDKLHGSQSVVIKVLKSDRPTRRQIVQFNNEYELTKDLNVAGVRKGLSMTTIEGRYALVLDYIEGKTLKEALIQDNGVDHNGVEHSALRNLPTAQFLADFLHLALAITNALDEIHQHRIIHKDINSHNILVTTSTPENAPQKKWNPTIIDFGIATQLNLKRPHLSSPEELEGTLAYLSPEQTGRMNRVVDYRTDLYSLGVTLYEVLTGRLPFEMTDALALVHAHLAINPTPPTTVNPAIPPALSDIIMKLLAKNAEDRYQSAIGLAADLIICQQQLETKGVLVSFPLAHTDFSTQFTLPQTLYGREAERQTLLDAFDQCGQDAGSNQLVLVAGYSGIGKSALVHELHKPVTARRGYFISGKFEQYQRDIPFFGLVAAIRELIEYLLTEREAQLVQWRSRLLDALGGDGQVLIELVPQLALILGEQPEANPLGPQESQNRLHHLFPKLIAVFAQKEHPLVLFLDDLQWADLATLKLLQQMVMDQSQQALLLIGAYRDNEVDQHHPLQALIEELRTRNIPLHQLALEPLRVTDTQALLADLLTVNAQTKQAEPQDQRAERAERTHSIAALSQLLQTRTGGNPFFLREFLTSLYQSELLRFDPGSGQWLWDLAEINALSSTESVVDLLENRLRQLPAKTQSILQLAACIGNRFSFEVLVIIADQPAKAVHQQLWPALEAGLIVPLGENYRYVMSLDAGTHAANDVNIDTLNTEQDEPIYKFVHDRVQQAAYGLIDAVDSASVHQQIGQLMRQKLSPAEQHERLFELVGHLNKVLDGNEGGMRPELLADEEQMRIARLNLQAGEKAIAAAAFSPALRYLQTSWHIIRGMVAHDNHDKNQSTQNESVAWRDHYDMVLKLHNLMVEAAYVAGELDLMHDTLEAVMTHAHTDWDKMPASTTLLRYYASSNQYMAGAAWGRQVLRLAGVDLPEKPSRFYVVRLFLQTDRALHRVTAQNRFNPLSDRDWSRLLTRPDMQDPQKQAIMAVVRVLLGIAFFADQDLVPLLICTGVQLSLTYGNSPESASTYGTFAAALAESDFGRTKYSYELGQTALTLANRYQVKGLQGETLLYTNGFINHRHMPVHQTFAGLLDASRHSLEAGDVHNACSAVMLYAVSIYNWGYALPQVAQEYEHYRSFLEKYHLDTYIHFMSLYQQLVFNLLGQSDDPCQLQGDVYDEVEMLPRYHAEKDYTALVILYRRKNELCYLHGRFEEALGYMQIVEQHINVGRGMAERPLIYLYGALIRLALYPSVTRPEQRQFMRVIKTNLRQIKKLAKHAPANYLHFYALINAEIARVEGKNTLARERYIEAITQCKAQHYIHHEALAFELAGQFAESQGQSWVAQTYLREAYAAYQQWGAVTKLQHLQSNFPHFLAEGRSIAQTLYDRAATQHKIPRTMTATTDLGTLDVRTILKASQTISSEIMIGHLLAKMMRVVLESAGAQRAVLVLRWDDQWMIQADLNWQEAEIESQKMSQPIVMDTTLLPDATEIVPVGLVNFIIRTGHTLILDHGVTETQFAHDPYFRSNHPPSLLCMPIVNQGTTSGLLYLENYLSTDVFSSERIEVLTMLSSQMAISLNNALLYEHLEERVAERTSELTQTLTALQTTQQALVEAKEQAERASLSKSTFLSQMTHELRTPMNGVLGMATLLDDTILDAKQQEMLDTIRGSGDTLLTIINDILDFSKIEANKLELEKVPFEIKGCIEDTFALVQANAASKGLSLTYHIASDTPKGVVQDVTRVRQILTNLVGNAVKFTDTGGITVTVQSSLASAADTNTHQPVRTESQNGREIDDSQERGSYLLHFIVKDTGIGIPVNRIDRLFQSFSQADETTTRKYGGTGLGLAISKQLCGLMGGEIWVESEVNVGSAFHFTILARQTQRYARQTQHVSKLNTKMAQQKPLRILLAEDNVVNQKVALGVLRKCGYTADVAANGLEAIDALMRQPYDVILMDVHMPEMDGLTATQRIRHNWPPDKQPTIIALTADAMEQQKEAYLGMGMDDFVTKPIRISALMSALDRVPNHALS
ncbi:MAG: AAA family ATPase [Chloroflexota bacterium]